MVKKLGASPRHIDLSTRVTPDGGGVSPVEKRIPVKTAVVGSRPPKQ